MPERYARFHAGFPLDDVYLGLPPRLRNDAYLYLLALNGHQRATEGDWDVPMSVAVAIAQSMGLNADKMLNALGQIEDSDGHPRIVVRVSEGIRLLKYRKWQDSPEQIAELKKVRSEAGIRGAAIRWGHPTQIKDAREPMANAMASAMAPPMASAMANANGKNGKPIAEGEGEGESLITPPDPPTRQPDAVKGPDEATVEVANGLSGLLGRVLSGQELIECQLALNQYAYLSAQDLVERAKDHQAWCVDNGHPVKRTVAGFTDSWRRHNDHVADQPGARKAGRISTGRTSGMSSLGDLLKPKEASL